MSPITASCTLRNFKAMVVFLQQPASHHLNVFNNWSQCSTHFRSLRSLTWWLNQISPNTFMIFTPITEKEHYFSHYPWTKRTLQLYHFFTVTPFLKKKKRFIGIMIKNDIIQKKIFKWPTWQPANQWHIHVKKNPDKFMELW